MSGRPYEGMNELFVVPGAVGPYGDGYPVRVRGDSYGALVTQDLNGRYAESVRRGDMYICTVTTAAALLLSATTGLHPTIWNPSGSNVVVYPVALRFSFLSGTTVIGAPLWALTSDAGSAIGTAAPIVTFTNVAPRNALLGSGNVAKFKFAPATCTFTAAPTVIAATGLSFGAVAPTNGGGPTPVDLDGMIGIMPGHALSLTYSVTTSTSLWFTSIYAVQRPLTLDM